MKALRFASARPFSTLLAGCLLLAAVLMLTACAPPVAMGAASGVGLLGVGALYQFGVGEQTVQLDTEDDNSVTSFERRLSAAHERETEQRLNTQQEAHDEEVETLQGEIQTLQGVAVDETLRLRQLSRGEDLEVEDEREYLEGLSAQRLQRELKHARDEAKTLSTKPTLSEGDQGDPTGGDENPFTPGAGSES